MVSAGLTLETRSNGPPRNLMGPNRTTEHQQAVVHPKSAISAVLAHRYLSFSDYAPRRLTPNIPDGFETRGIGPGAECGRTKNELSEARRRPAREHQPEAVRPIKSASLGISPIWVFVLSFPPRPIPSVSAVSKILVLVGAEYRSGGNGLQGHVHIGPPRKLSEPDGPHATQTGWRRAV